MLVVTAQSHALQSVAYKTGKDLRTCHFNEVLRGSVASERKSRVREIIVSSIPCHCEGSTVDGSYLWD